MKIALLTIWHEKNFGAELQAYATIKTLQKLGHEVEMIDIRISDCRSENIRGKIGSLITSIGPSHRSFCKFWKDNIPTTRRYKSLEELQTNPPKADVYMVGSDQVWNPDITSVLMTPVFFLDFGDEKVRRVSYASSFGVSEWQHPKLKVIIKSLLENFHSISCREESGVHILSSEFGVSAQCVVDPCLLMEDYSDLVGEIQEKKTLVYYPLNQDPELCQYAVDLASKIGLIPINNNRCTRLFGKIIWDRVNINEWVRNIAESQFVITRSFHGMVFSLFYDRQFAVLTSANGRNTRLSSLLSKLGLEDRIFTSLEELDKAKPWQNKIDFTKVKESLMKLKTDSLNFIRNAVTI